LFHDGNLCFDLLEVKWLLLKILLYKPDLKSAGLKLGTLPRLFMVRLGKQVE